MPYGSNDYGFHKNYKYSYMNLCMHRNDDTCDWTDTYTYVHGVAYMALNTVDCPVHAPPH